MSEIYRRPSFRAIALVLVGVVIGLMIAGGLALWDANRKVQLLASLDFRIHDPGIPENVLTTLGGARDGPRHEEGTSPPSPSPASRAQIAQDLLFAAYDSWDVPKAYSTLRLQMEQEVPKEPADDYPARSEKYFKEQCANWLDHIRSVAFKQGVAAERKKHAAANDAEEALRQKAIEFLTRWTPPQPIATKPE